MISPVQFCMKKVLPLNGHTNNTKRINYTAWSISSISTDPEPSAIVQKVLTLNSHTKKTQRINNYSNYVVPKRIFRAIGYQSNSLGMGATNPKKSFSPHPPSKTDKYRQISSNKCENSHGVCCKYWKKASRHARHIHQVVTLCLGSLLCGFLRAGLHQIQGHNDFSGSVLYEKKVLPLNGHTNNTKRINYTAWSISSISTDPEPSAISTTPKGSKGAWLQSLGVPSCGTL